MHGAKSPQVRAAAARQVALDLAEKQRMRLARSARSLGVNPLDGDWVGALKLALARQRDLEEILMDTIQKLEMDGEPVKVRALLDAYQGMLRDLRDTAAVMGRIDLDAVELRLDEGRMALVERGLEAYRQAAGVDEDRHAAGLKAMAGELRRVG